MGKFGRFTSRVKNGIIRIRRAGVPHEETVIIPAIAIYVCDSVFGPSGWHFWVPMILMPTICFACGAWLGLAWRGFPVLRVVLRPVYIGVLTTLLFMLLHDEPVSKHDAEHSVLLTVSTVGPLFYFGYLYAAMARDVALRRFSSQEHRKRYLESVAWRRYIWQLARDKEDKNAASDWDLFVSKIVQSCMDIKGLIALFSLLGTLIYWLWRFIRAVMPTAAGQ
jgi:hypothetical protein